jgi:hypothetical protein
MIDLTKEITRNKFDKHSRQVYAISVSDTKSAPRVFLSKDTAYTFMERIQAQLDSVACLERVELNDLDVRPDHIVSEGGKSYSLLTLTIEY